MNEWMCIYIPHISHIVSRRFTILIEWDRTSACKGASGRRYRFIFDLTRPPNPCMKCTMQLQIDHHTGNYVPYSFRQVCGFFNVHCWPCNTEDAGDGAYGETSNVINQKVGDAISHLANNHLTFATQFHVFASSSDWLNTLMLPFHIYWLRGIANSIKLSFLMELDFCFLPPLPLNIELSNTLHQNTNSVLRGRA